MDIVEIRQIAEELGIHHWLHDYEINTESEPIEFEEIFIPVVQEISIPIVERISINMEINPFDLDWLGPQKQPSNSSDWYWLEPEELPSEEDMKEFLNIENDIWI